MKKILLIASIAVGMSLVSCGQMVSTSMKTDVDSLSYAVGTDLGGMAFGFDSTMNPEIVAGAILDAFKKNSKMTREQAGAFIQEYMTVGKAAKNAKASQEFLTKIEKESGVQKTASGLMYKIENAGSEPKAMLGDTLSVHYVLTTPEGTQLDSSLARGEPMTFPNVEGAMIKGFTEGVMLLGEGGKATLYIPSELGYGDQGAGGQIGPKQALVFEVELLKIVKPTAEATPAK